MKIHVWVPDYVSVTGGIQAFSRFLVRALGELYPSAYLSVFSKNDLTNALGDGTVGSFHAFGWWAPSLRTLAFSTRLFREARHDKPDLIIATHANFAPLARTLQRIGQTPNIVVGHGVEVWNIEKTPNRRALLASNRLVTVSNFTRDRMAQSLGMRAHKIEILPDTFDEHKFVIRHKPNFLVKRYGLTVGQPVILTVARLSESEKYKGYDQVLRALPEIRRVFPDVRYVLGGRGPDRPRVVALIKELQLEENVILAGYIPDHELCAHYNLCDVFAMPSKGEGFGIVFLEALACGKPVIAGNKDGSVDAVLNGELGVLVDPDSVEEIAGALVAILRRKAETLKPETLKSYSKCGVRSAEGEMMGMAESEFRNPHSAIRISEIIFQPEELRRRVIEAYGYEKFKQRLAAVLETLLKAES